MAGKNKKEMKSKSYNPFRMWGSWAGIFASFFVPLPLSTSSSVYTPYIYFFIFSIELMIKSFSKMLENMTPSLMTLALMFMLIPPVLGFIMGWGIHSLVRKFRK